MTHPPPYLGRIGDAKEAQSAVKLLRTGRDLLELQDGRANGGGVHILREKGSG